MAKAKEDTGKLKSKSSAAHTRTVAIDLNPTTYTESFDLTTELTTNIDTYRTDTNTGECVTLRPVPGYLTESIERYQSQFSLLSPTSQSRRPGISPIAAACILGGLQSLRSHPTVKSLTDLKNHLRTLPSSLDDNRYDLVSSWFRSFSVDIMPGYSSGNRGLNISLPEPIKAQLSGMSANLSISQGSLGSILIAEVMREQETTLAGHRRKLDESVKIFLILCQTRLTALESVLEMLRGSK